MASTTNGFDDDLPERVEGWLNVWDVDAEKEASLFTDGRTPLPIWEPLFCVLCRQQATLSHFSSEKAANSRAPVDGNQTEKSLCAEAPAPVRLDSGKVEFDKRWGYETLECIKENVLQQFQPDLGSLEVFSRSQTLERCRESDGAYEKGLGERRGSMPIAVDASLEDMDTGSTPSRLASFFSKKVNKSNLKRTKSVTKLDRKRAGADNELVEGKSRSVGVAPLKRTMSLGRLTRRGWLNRSRRGHIAADNAGDRVDSAENPMKSRSHESLLSVAVALSSVDLSTASDVQIRPLHSSVLGSAHCFQVSSSGIGSKFYSCRTAAERQNWIEHLRKAVQPSQEQSRRTDNSLKLSILEAKNVPAKKRYFCELCLDKTLYARSTTNTKGDMLFWGEHFDFNNLPSVQTITVNLYREPDKKKKKEKNTLVGTVNIAVSDVSGRQPVERWYTATAAVSKSGREARGSELPLLRIRARYQAVQILPMAAYQSFIKYIQTDYCLLVDILEPIVSVKAKEEIATSLVHILQKLGGAHDFLSDIIMAEVDKLENENLAFRGNSIATKAMEAYMKLVGEKYMRNTLADFIHTVVEATDDCEVDPARVSNNAQLLQQQANLVMYCQMAWFKVINSHCFFPMELRQVFASVRERCEARHASRTTTNNSTTPSSTDPTTTTTVDKDTLSERLLSACVFLRLLCPAILSPSLFGLTNSFPAARAGRNLTLITKTIQNLANFTKFGAKEEFMTFMNDFVEHEMSSMKQFIQRISTMTDPESTAKFDGYIDLGKELSILHTILVESLEKVNPLTCEVKLQWLRSVLNDITEMLANPSSTAAQQQQPECKMDATDTTCAKQTPCEPTDETNTTIVTEQVTHVSSMTHVVNAVHAATDKETHVATISRFINDTESFPSDSLVWPDNVSGRTKRSQKSRWNGRTLNQLHGRCRSETAIDMHHHRRNHAMETCPVEACPTAGHTPRQASDTVDESWQRIVSAADLVSTDYSQLLVAFMDADPANSSLDGESTVASSGYQSLTYSQSSSPIDPTTNSANSSTRQQPLSFANPLFGHDASGVTCSPSSSSLSSGSDGGKRACRRSGCLRRTEQPNEGVRWTEQLTLVPASSAESLTPPPSRWTPSSSGDGCFISPQPLSLMANGHTDSPRVADLPPLTAGELPPLPSPTGSMSGDPLGKRTASTASQNTVRMGVRSVQRKLHEKTKVEYEQELSKVSSELASVQAMLAHSQDQLRRETTARQRVATECAAQLRRSEQRMAEQQRRKDQQMRDIIHRLIGVEEELRREQVALHSVVAQKQAQLEQQSRRIQSLDAANARLVNTLAQLRGQQEGSAVNGIDSPTKIRLAGENGQLKSSSC